MLFSSRGQVAWVLLFGKLVTLAVNDQQVPEPSERVEEEGEHGSWASRCFSFWVLARKGQLRAALNEAGSHPVNCLVQ